MSELKSRPPEKSKHSLDAFIAGAEEKTATEPSKHQKAYPWQEAGIRLDVNKTFNLRLPEPYLLKLKFISEQTPDSMQMFCLRVIKDAIDKKIADLTK